MRPREEDLAGVHARLCGWFSGMLPHARGLRLSELKRPGAGLSNETFLCRLSWREDGGEHSEELVIRLAPTRFQVFPEYDLPGQFRIMQALAPTDVPVPRVRWLEEDASVLGCPFYVMERIDGDIPSEVPPYHAFGLCFDATPERRASMWWSGVQTLARIHAVDWETPGLSFLGKPGPGSGPLDRQLDYYERFLRWAAQEPQPILDAALRWLREHTFTPARLSLCWGDARLPNLIYRDDGVAGVLDWEMAFLGDPEADLGWWLFMDWQGSEGYGIPRLEGFPDTAETVARYQELTGRPVQNLFYNDVFAAFRFGVIMARVAGHLQEMGIPTPSEDFATNNPCTQRLAALLDLPPPGRAARGLTHLGQATVCVQFHLTGVGGCDWYLVAERGAGTRHEGTVADPDTTLTVSAADWQAIRNGELDRTQAYMSGRLKIEGDVTLLMQLEDVITRLGAG